MRELNRQCRMVLAVALFIATTCVGLFAQGQPSNQQITSELEALKARIQQLETQLQATNTKATEAKKEADSAVKVTEQAAPVLVKLSKGQLQIGHTNVFLNGWIEASANFRAHDVIAGPSQSNVSSFPYPIQPQYAASEFQTGPPQTRFGLNSVSDLSNNYVLKMKLEFDLLAGSNAANTGNVNGSWIPRMRQNWVQIDNTKAKWHILAGQAYSTIVPNGNNVQADGSPSPNLAWTLLPGTDAPPVPDDASIPGHSSSRTMQLRLVKEVAPNAAVMLAFENNTVTWGGDRKTITGAAVPVVSDASYNSSSLFTDLGTIPDIIVKAGYDPTPRAHLEAWGMFRQYKDNAGTWNPTLSGVSKVGKVYAGGGQVSGYLKLIPQKLDFQFLGGYGSFNSLMNNYGADVTYDINGKPVPVYEKDLSFQFIPHFTKNFDMYFQTGVERFGAAGVNAGSSITSAYGYGNPYSTGSAAGVAPCMLKTTSSTGALTATCAADNRTLFNFLVTPVYRMINNPKLGHLDFLPQVLYGRRFSFKDQNGVTAHTSNIAVEVCLRYWPF